MKTSTYASLAIAMIAAMLPVGGGGGISVPPQVPAGVNISPSYAASAQQPTKQFTAAVSGSTERSATRKMRNVSGRDATVEVDASPELYGAPGTVPVQVLKLMAAQPLLFEPMAAGAASETTGYLARSGQDQIRLGANSMEVFLPRASSDCTTGRDPAASDCRPETGNVEVISIAFSGAAAKPAISHVGEPRSRVNYLLGADQSKWRIGVPQFDRVRYLGMYPGIDVEFYGNQSRLEFDYRIAPGTDPDVLGLQISGAQRLRADSGGDLEISAAGSTLRLPKPLAYQDDNGKRKEVSVRYALKGDSVRFVLGAYDKTQPLVIDPMLLFFAPLDWSYIYSTGYRYKSGAGMVLDSRGNVVVAGTTSEAYCPSDPCTDNTVFATQIFISKLSAKTGSILSTTRIGSWPSLGNKRISVTGLATDSRANILLSGNGSRSLLPGFTAHFAPVYSDETGFLLKLDANGIAPIYSLDLGAVFSPVISIDRNDNVLLAGEANAGLAGLPLIPGVQFTVNPAAFSAHVYLQKFSPDGRLLFATVLGGSSWDRPTDVAADPQGDFYVTGSTWSTDFYLRNAALGTLQPWSTTRFVARIRPDGSLPIYSTFVGSGGEFSAYSPSISVDESGAAYVAFSTASPYMPVTPGAVQPAMSSPICLQPCQIEGFVAKLDPIGGWVYSTYLGGSRDEWVTGIAAYHGRAYVAGTTQSANFPVRDAMQSTLLGSEAGFLTAINAQGSAFRFSTYLNGQTGGANGPVLPSGRLVSNGHGAFYLGGPVGVAKIDDGADCRDTTGDGNVDDDGDGLCDNWETEGIDFDGDGIIDLPLNEPPYNANPRHKDVFLEVDWMDCAQPGSQPCTVPHSDQPVPGALLDVIAAFRNAPVNNPDGTLGVNLHVMYGEAVPHADVISFAQRQPGTLDDFDDIKLGDGLCSTTASHGYFGSEADRTSPNCENIMEARRMVFRYLLFGHEFSFWDEDSHSFIHDGFSGVAETPGNDFMVTLGMWDDAKIAKAGGRQAVEAGTFMHEMGHTLGLHHGGSDDIGCKPNYLSVMNYNFQFPNNDPTRPLDYSSVQFDLDERHLDETKGVQATFGGLQAFIIYAGSNGITVRPLPMTGLPIDWDRDGAISVDTHADINNFVNKGCGVDDLAPYGVPDGETPLAGFDDWANLKYDFRDTVDYLDGAHWSAENVREPTPDQVARDAQEVDFDNDGFSNADDNCPAVSNPGQEDANGNGIGDACEQPADLAVSLAVSADSLPMGGNLLLTAEITNHGPSRATQAVATFTLPVSLTVASLQPQQGTCTQNQNSVRCDLGNLPSTMSSTVLLSLTPTAVGQFSSSVSVASLEADSNASNNNATANVTVTAAPPPAASIERISLTSAGEQANLDSTTAAVTPDGRYLVFQSWANLSSLDADPGYQPQPDVYLRDRGTGQTELVTVNSAGEKLQPYIVGASCTTDGDSYQKANLSPSVSANGRFVAFAHCPTNFGAGYQSSGHSDIFVRDRQNGTTELISVSTTGEQGNGRSIRPSITSDGRFIVFESDATNLVGGDTNGLRDIFVRDRLLNTTERVNVSDSGGQTQTTCGSTSLEYVSGSRNAAITPDGRYVVFETPDIGLVDSLPSQQCYQHYADVFVRDRQTQTTRWVTRSVAEAIMTAFGRTTPGEFHEPAISADGNSIAFLSYWGTCGATSDWCKSKTFVWDRESGTVTPIPKTADEATGYPQEVHRWAITLSGDGQTVAFSKSYYGGTADIVFYNRPNQQFETILHVEGGNPWGSLLVPTADYDGSYPGNRLSLTPDGDLAFASVNTGLVPNDTNNAADVFLWRRPDLPKPTANPSGSYIGWADSAANPAFINFDASGSEDPGGAALTARWNFGDGTAEVTAPVAQKVQHRFAAEGTYTATLVVNNGAEDSAPATASVEVLSSLPANEFLVLPECGAAGTDIDLYLGNIPLVSRDGGWNLGGQPPNGGLLPAIADQDPAKQMALDFSGPGVTYSVTLPVSSSWSITPLDFAASANWAIPADWGNGPYTVSTGTSSATLNIPCVVPDQIKNSPVAKAGGPYDGTVGQPIQFDGSGSSDPNGKPLTFLWNFGDGTTSTEVKPQHSYAGTLLYGVSLTVSNGESASLCLESGCYTTALVSSGADAIAPTTAAAMSVAPNTAGWHRSDFTVSLIASDNEGGSGIKEITYSVSGAQQIPPTTVAGSTVAVPFTAEGQSSITYSATDVAGNSEAPHTLTVKMDKTPPAVSIGGVADGSKYFSDSVPAGTCAATDSGSGIATEPVYAITSGDLTQGGEITGTCSGAVDAAGNQAESVSATFTVYLIPVTTTVQVHSSASAPIVGETVTFTATVTAPLGVPDGKVAFEEGSTSLGTDDLDASGVATLAVSSLSVGSHSITASYGGTNRYAASRSAVFTQTVDPAPDFTLVSNPTALTLAHGQSGTVVLTVTPTENFDQTLTFGCSGLPAGVTCSFAPPTLAPSGTAATTTLTISVLRTVATGHTTTWPFTLAAGLFAFCSIGTGLRRRSKSVSRLLLVIAFAALLAGCGGGFSAAPATSSVNVTASAGTLQHSVSLTLTVR